MTPLPVKLAPAWFRPRSFLIGLAAGLALLSGLGWRAAHVDYHPGFTRFCPSISPEGNYYPTIGEMCSIVRQRCRPGQVLVIVGGNSIFFGVGQPAAEMWTRRLQDLLGDRYCVLNFAFRGASASDGGALVAEVLRREYPRQIYVANVAPVEGIYGLGSDPYRFLFWEAYFKGLLASYPPRSADVRLELARNPAYHHDVPGLVGSVWLDRLLHFHDLWNYVTMQWANTVPYPTHPDLPELAWPRIRFVDDEPDFRAIPFEARFPNSSLPLEMPIVRGYSALNYRRTAAGGWEMLPASRAQMQRFLGSAMPVPLRGRTLIVVSQSSPFYMDQLSPDERRRDTAACEDSIANWRAAGYQAITYSDDFRAEDFGDRAHLTVDGGDKLARTVAGEVRRIASARGYFPPAKGAP